MHEILAFVPNLIRQYANQEEAALALGRSPSDPSLPVFQPIFDRSTQLTQFIRYSYPDFGPLFRLNFEYLRNLSLASQSGQVSLPSSLPIPPIHHYLEVGTFEGRSAFHVLATLGATPDISVTCVDPFRQSFSEATAKITDVRRSFERNLQEVAAAQPIHPIWYDLSLPEVVPSKSLSSRKGFGPGNTTTGHWAGPAQTSAKPMICDSPDFIYIDGDHTHPAVLMDLICAQRIIRDRAFILLDDVGQQPDDFPRESHPAGVHAGMKDWLRLQPILFEKDTITEIQIPDSYQRAFLIVKNV